MQKRISYQQIEDLPTNHPLVKQFNNQLKEDEEVAQLMAVDNGPFEDEESLEYFNHFIAGDR